MIDESGYGPWIDKEEQYPGFILPGDMVQLLTASGEIRELPYEVQIELTMPEGEAEIVCYRLRGPEVCEHGRPQVCCVRCDDDQS